MASAPPAVAIVGGGLAGLAAGCALAESGFRVTLFERRPYLGGRASSYEHPGTGEIVDNCQHVLFGLCTNLLEFNKTIGIEDKIRWFDRMTFIEPGGRQSVLEPTFLPAPFHVMPSFFRFKFLNAWDKITLSGGLAALVSVIPKKDDGTSFQDWLHRHGQTPASIERFWKPILVSALSEDLDRIAVPYAAQVVRESMKSRLARRMGIPTVPLTELYNGARDYITARGGSVRFRNGVQSFTPTSHGVRLKLQDSLQDSDQEFDYGVLAVPFDSLSKMLPESPDGLGLREKLGHFETSPITGIHFWFDRQISDLPHAVLLDRTIQWMFHKSKLLAKNSQIIENEQPARESTAKGGLAKSSGAHSSASNSSLNHSSVSKSSVSNNRASEGRNTLAQGASPGYTDKATESRRDGTNSTKNPATPSYVELVISSSKSLLQKSRQEIIDLALGELREFFPDARTANLVKATVIKEVNATFSPTPGVDQYRPTSHSPWPRIFLAGDWTATGWPATMEGAVRSGYLAAEAVTGNAGSAKKFVVPDLPAKGLMRILD